MNKKKTLPPNWLYGQTRVVAESSERTADTTRVVAESLDELFSLSSFRNAQWNQWLSLKVQVQPVLRCVLALWSFFEILSGQKATCLSPLPKSACLQGRNSEQINEASLWCTCNPVASSPNKGVSLLARWLKAKKARTSRLDVFVKKMTCTWRRGSVWTSGHPRPCVDGYITWNRSPWRERRTR